MKVTGERLIPGSHNFSDLEHLNRYYFVINQIQLKDKVVVDIASGEGYGSNILSDYSLYVTGIDISFEAIEYAKKKYCKSNLKYIQGNASEIPIDDNSVDVVVSFETIEHHNEHIEMIQEIKRILKPKGILVISSPDKYNYSDLPKYINKFHVKELYYDEFKKLISSHFNNMFFFSQRIFGGSLIALDGDYDEYMKPIVVNEFGVTKPIIPLYNIAIATDDVEYGISSQIVLYTDHEKLITRSDLDEATEIVVLDTISKIKNTITWRLGNAILYPFKLFKRIITL